MRTRTAILIGAVLLSATSLAWTADSDTPPDETPASSTAPSPTPVVSAYVRRIAIGTCGTCHGRNGVSEQPKFPNLAGQNPTYLAAQLRAFRAQSRGDSDAISYMWGMASPLEDETIDALSQYYARLSPPKASRTPAPARGREIYEQGVSALGVPACATCHGPDGHGIADFPRLAGQHAQYVLKQLASFQNNMRNMAVMHGVAQGLQLQDMQAVAAYLESLK